MNINLMPFGISWCVLALIVLGLIVYRKTVADREDDSIHLEGSTSDQVAVGHKLAVIDRWGKIITVFALVYGLALGAIWFYQYWVESSRIGLQ